MDIEKYLNESEVTEKKFAPVGNCADKQTCEFLHAAMGISTEAGELLDVAKKKIVYGKDVDWVNVKEELGDLMWYIAIVARQLEEMGMGDFGDILQVNIDKLHARYPDGFTQFDALNRDLDNERGILEKTG